MAKIQFNHYLHEQGSRNELAEWIYSQILDEYDGTEEDLLELLGDNQPFYEVGFKCELDTETGAVVILSII